MVRCGFKNGHQKDMCFKGIELRAQKYANQSRFNSQLDWMGPIWPLNEQEHLHFDKE